MEMKKIEGLTAEEFETEIRIEPKDCVMKSNSVRQMVSNS